MVLSASLLIVFVLMGIAVAMLSNPGKRLGLHWSDLWRWDGTLDRGPYLLIGAVAFALKHNLDRAIALLVFHRPWTVFNYWIPPTQAIRIASLPKDDAAFLATMVGVALPFIWVGVVLTLRRLRSAGLPLWLVFAFFLPVINLAFFGILSIIPFRERTSPAPARRGGMLSRIIPDHPAGSAAMSLLTTVPLALVPVKFWGFTNYGWGLFVGLPFCLGFSSVLLYGYHRPRRLGTCLAVASLSVLLAGAALLALAVEGGICLAMALPIALALALIGGLIGYAIQNRGWDAAQARSLLMLTALFAPALMAAESARSLEPPLFVVRTSIEISATPDQVWRRLISFPTISTPGEWAFRLGIAYPIAASIHGEGPGALRECLFSTGVFLERIETWEKERLLRFSIVTQPVIMRELTPYSEIHPRHLDGYLQPRRAEFVLTPLAGGRTLLEGTSWYSNRMWPAGYWQLWSDWIVHRVHMRVFRHIKRLSELGD